MKKELFAIILLLINTHIFASIITVKQDGTGDYSTIQAAVDDIYQTDTILVWPGTYYENIVIDGSCLTLASLSLTTGDPSYRNTTIIDGGQNGSCIAIFPKPQWLKDNYIHGLTLQNGSGYNWYGYDVQKWGGGIYIAESEPVPSDNKNRKKTKKNNGPDIYFTCHIDNCIIKDNTATESGGGIFIGWHSEAVVSNSLIAGNESVYSAGGGILGATYTSMRLSNTTIKENKAFVAGGLMFGYESTGVFDSVNRCSIYNNYAAEGSDLKIGGKSYHTDVYLDTLTVLEQERYFASFTDNEGYYNDDSVTIDVQHGWLEPVDNDIYVDPGNGNDNNSGLDAGNALKTINFALRKIAIDSLDPNTIHLANGIYSDSANGEVFPLGLRQFVNLRGQSMDSVVLDANYTDLILAGDNDCSDYSISRMKFVRGGFVNYMYMAFPKHLERTIILYEQGDNISIDSIIIENCWSNHYVGSIDAGTGNNFRLSNSRFENNVGGNALGASARYLGDTNYIENCIFKGHSPDFNHPDSTKRRSSTITLAGSYQAVSIVSNCLFINNDDCVYSAVGGNHYPEIKENYFINCTFANNSKNLGYYSLWVDGTANSFYNCIFDNNALVPDYIAVSDFIGFGETSLSIYNSLVENGEDAIRKEQSSVSVFYDHHTNIDEDPIFLGMWDHPYQIADGSPCINTGTLANLPDFIVLPETDLAGNPRIVGDSIDMGCYEWNPTIVGFNEIGPGSEKEKPKLLTASPNPFSSSTRVSIKYKSEETVKVEIYDSFGHRVKTMLTSNLSEGNYELKWDGTDNNGNHLPKGVYFVIMFSGEKEAESLKVIKR